MTRRLFEEAARLWPDQPILEFGHDTAVAAVRKKLLEILKAKFGKDAEKGANPSKHEWDEAANSTKNKKFVQASLLRYALPPFKQILELDVTEFLVKERAVLRKTGCV